METDHIVSLVGYLKSYKNVEEREKEIKSYSKEFIISIINECLDNLNPNMPLSIKKDYGYCLGYLSFLSEHSAELIPRIEEAYEKNFIGVANCLRECIIMNKNVSDQFLSNRIDEYLNWNERPHWENPFVIIDQGIKAFSQSHPDLEKLENCKVNRFRLEELRKQFINTENLEKNNTKRGPDQEGNGTLHIMSIETNNFIYFIDGEVFDLFSEPNDEILEEVC